MKDSYSYSYNNVTSLTEEEFLAKVMSSRDLENPEKFTKSCPEDILKIERILDLRLGILKGEVYYLQRYACECGRVQTMYDFVFTALVDADHDKSLVVHTLIGGKFLINKPRRVRCSNCARQPFDPLSYHMSTNYACSIV